MLCEQLQLTPVYAPDEMSARAAPLSPLTVPPAGQLRALRDLAARGDIKNLQHQMTQLEALGDRSTRRSSRSCAAHRRLSDEGAAPLAQNARGDRP